MLSVYNISLRATALMLSLLTPLVNAGPLGVDTTLSFSDNAIKLNLTLPSQENYCVTEPDVCKRIREYKRPSLLPNLFEGEVTKADRVIFYTLHILDAYTTDRAIRGGYAKEANPLLGSYPSTGRIWGQKMAVIALYEYAQWIDNKTYIVTANIVTGLAVANNLNVIIKSE